MASPPNPTGPFVDPLFEGADDPRCLVDAAGRVLRANAAWLRATGLRPEEAVGSRLPELLQGRTADGDAPGHPAEAAGAPALDGAAATLGAILDAASESIWLFSAEGVALGANRTALDRWGRPAETVIGTHILEHLPGPLGEARLARMREVARTGREVRFEDERAGIRFEHTFCPVREPDGRVWRVAIFSRDVTLRHRAEESLRRYQLLARLSRDAVLLIRRDDGRIVDANPAAEAIYGYGRDELLALRVTDLRADGDSGHASRQMALADEAGLLFEAIHRRKDGRTFDVEVSSQGADVDGTRMLVSVMRDVSERRRAEAALRESEDRHRRIVEHVADGIFVADAEGRYTEVNAAGCELLGLTREEVLARTFLDVLAPSEHARLQEGVASFADGKVHRSEWRFRRKDGQEFVGELDGRRLPDGTFQGILRDVTERRRAEDELRRASQQKSDFLAVLAHELRNPLTAIRNGVHILELSAPESDQARRAREILHRQAEQLARLVDDLLDVTRLSKGKTELRRERLDLGELVRRTAEDLQFLFDQAGVALAQERPAGPIWIDGDAARLAQVLGNLLHNAAKFTPAGGRVTVRLAAEAGQAVLAVRDTGAGMEPGQEHLMFEPFAQGPQGPARVGSGLGLGLSLVKGLVELHGGRLRAVSGGVGRGTEFQVSLPLAAPPTRVEPQAASGPAGGRSVLVIEDNLDAGRSLAELLGLAGHRVRLAHDGRSGLSAARAQRPDLILCDVGLPDMDGYEVARAVRGDPTLAGVRMVALTGYAQPRDRAAALAAGFDAHLPKPPPLDRLEALLRGEVG